MEQIKSERVCVWCGKKLEGRKRKYCGDLCKYRHISAEKDHVVKFSVAQHLRMLRAGRRHRLGKVGIRLN